jgi:3-methyl-2-oxobutanoate hydroxymethyltransferase
VQEYISKNKIMERVTVRALHEMKRNGKKIVAVVGWDFQIARIADRAGVDIISVGDSVGINLWGRENEQDVTVDEMVLVCRAVRRGTTRALVSCDFPYGPFQQGIESAVAAARRLVNEGGADMIKVDGAADFPEAVAAIVRVGIPVFAQFGHRDADSQAAAKFVAAAQRLEQAGASLIDFIHSGPAAGPAVVNAVSIPVLGGLGGGPWLDGRLRRVDAAIGYAFAALDAKTENYANVAQITLDALTAYAEDVRAGRQIK